MIIIRETSILPLGDGGWTGSVIVVLMAGFMYSETYTSVVYTVNRIIYTFSIIVISSGVHDSSLHATSSCVHQRKYPLLCSLSATPEKEVCTRCAVSSSRRSGNVVLMCRYQINPKVVVIVVVVIHLVRAPIAVPLLRVTPCGGPKFRIKIPERYSQR